MEVESDCFGLVPPVNRDVGLCDGVVTTVRDLGRWALLVQVGGEGFGLRRGLR